MSQKVNSKQIRFLRGIHSITRVMMEQGALTNYQALVLENVRHRRSAEEIISDEGFKAPFLHELRCYGKNGAQTRQLYIDESYDLLEANDKGALVPATGASAVSHSSEIEALPPSGDRGEETEQKILFLHCEGPVTRGGGMCSYGSIDYRNLMQEFAEDPSVSGLVLLTDTPGGDAMAMYDFEDGMRAWKATGKRSIQLVDGNCYSAGEAMGCQCDYQIAVNPHNGFGCVGAMVCGFITPANSENAITHERFLHIVAGQTPDKNAMWEKAANGDSAEVQEWVSESAQDFIDVMKANRPSVKDEHLTGKTYEAKDVMGSLCDGIGTVDDAIRYCLTGETTWQPAVSTTIPEASAPISLQTTLTPKDMTLIERIAAALGIKSEADVPATEQTVETPVQETVENPATAGKTPATEEPGAPASETSEATDAVPSGSPEGESAPSAEVPAAPTALEEQLTAQLADLQHQLQEQIDVNTALAESNTAALAAKDATIAQHVAEIDGLKQKLSDKEAEFASITTQLTDSQSLLAECKAALEAKDTKLTDLHSELTAAKAEIAELSSTAPACPAPAAPTAPAEQVDDTPDNFKEGMTAQEIIAVQKKKSASRRKKA